MAHRKIIIHHLEIVEIGAMISKNGKKMKESSNNSLILRIKYINLIKNLTLC